MGKEGDRDGEGGRERDEEGIKKIGLGRREGRRRMAGQGRMCGMRGRER